MGIDITLSDEWYLDNLKDFCGRKLFLGRTAEGIKAVYLVEKRIFDDKYFFHFETGDSAEKIIENEKSRILYKKSDLAQGKKKPYGWTYGDNREIKNNKGNVFEIRQYRCDFYGQKEIVKRITV